VRQLEFIGQLVQCIPFRWSQTFEAQLPSPWKCSKLFTPLEKFRWCRSFSIHSFAQFRVLWVGILGFGPTELGRAVRRALHLVPLRQ
jgi:hypothetical protein